MCVLLILHRSWRSSPAPFTSALCYKSHSRETRGPERRDEFSGRHLRQGADWGTPWPISGGHIDVRRWHREGRLRAGQISSLSWTRGGEPSGSIRVVTVADAVILMFGAQRRGHAEGKFPAQRVPITWTACHLGGRRPWFICSAFSGGHYCGRRVALLYGAGELFACRHCYGLVYASQQEALRERGLGKAQKIRTRLGGSSSIFDCFPAKPKGMHQRTYGRLRQSHDVAATRCTTALEKWLGRRPSR
jgi:hypothetical protein